MARVLIIGCGDIGSSLGLRLVAKGHEVWGLRRRTELLPRKIKAIRSDFAQGIPELPTELDFIFIITTADRFAEEAYQRAYVDVANNVARIGETYPDMRRIFFISSTSVYGQQAAEWVDEDTPPSAKSFSGRLLREAEKILLKSGHPVTVVRSAGIYGPGRSKTLDRVREGKAGCSTGEPKYVNLIHRQDLVAALEHLMQQTQLADLYLAVDNEPVERNTLLRWLARRLGVPEPPLQPEKKEAHLRRTGNKRCRNQRLRDTGFGFTYPTYRDGYQALLDT